MTSGLCALRVTHPTARSCLGALFVTPNSCTNTRSTRPIPLVAWTPLQAQLGPRALQQACNVAERARLCNKWVHTSNVIAGNNGVLNMQFPPVGHPITQHQPCSCPPSCWPTHCLTSIPQVSWRVCCSQQRLTKLQQSLSRMCLRAPCRASWPAFPRRAAV